MGLFSSTWGVLNEEEEEGGGGVTFSLSDSSWTHLQCVSLRGGMGKTYSSAAMNRKVLWGCAVPDGEQGCQLVVDSSPRDNLPSLMPYQEQFKGP